MDGKMNTRVERERPIAKPNFPLPTDFNPNPRRGAAAKRGAAATTVQGGSPLQDQRAHFYRKQTTESGFPVYGFYITEASDQDFQDSH